MVIPVRIEKDKIRSNEGQEIERNLMTMNFMPPHLI
jgi:hypothetical protein